MALVIALALSLPLVAVIVFRPLLRRLAVRNALRRPVEALLVILGSLLGTAIITGSLTVGDTIDRSIRAAAYDHLGPIDEQISVNGLEDGADLVARFDAFTASEIDGVLSFATAGAAVVNPGDDAAIQPRAQLIEVDFAEARAFGGDPSTTGIRGPSPEPGTAAVTDDLADKARLDVGDPILVFAYDRSLALTVDRILPRTGIAGFWPVDARQQAYNVLVAEGTIAELVAGGIPADAEPPRVFVTFSNVGGVESGADRTDEAIEQIEAALGNTGIRVDPTKQDVLDLAADVGSSLTQLYFTLGMFAVAAGVLLLVNIFVMLADERRSELGMLRALGMRRSPLVASFAVEGWIYAVIAAALGALAGIGVGWLIGWRADRILSTGQEVNQLNLEFTYTSRSVLTGFATGLSIALVTVLITSIRIARFNVIRAIRDIPDPGSTKPRRRWAALGLTVAVLGIGLSILGFSGPEPYALMTGPMLVLVGLGPQAARRLPGTVVSTIVASAVLAWSILAIPVIGFLDATVAIPVFLVQGLSMAAAAVVIVTVHQASIGRLIGRVSRGALAVRLGLAYPLARLFRTALTLAMFAVVILTLVYMSVLSFMFRGQGDDITADLSGGFGVIVTSNPSNPPSREDLAAVDGVITVAPLNYAAADFVIGEDEPVTWPVTGIGAEFAADPPSLQEQGDHGSNEAAWAALAADPDLIILDDFFLATGGGPPPDPADIGDTVVMTDPVSGRSKALTVTAISEEDMIGTGAFVSSATMQEVFGDRAVVNRFAVATVADRIVAERIETTYIANGTDAETVRGLVDEILAQQGAFFTLMQQFVGAGLVVGVAGIGVIMVRAVRERRRQVGVLRSLGFQPRAVAGAFVFEAGFVAVEGTVLGVAISLVASYALAESGADWAEGLQWGVPGGEILVIVAVSLVASAIAAIWPARRASQIRPAVALRVND